MTYPDPDPHPSGPLGPRTWVPMLRWARLTGWDHIAYIGAFGTEHTWTSQDHRVGVEFVDGLPARATVYRRRRRLSVAWEVEAAKFEVTSGDQLVAVLRALGVLPGLERAA